MFWYSAISGLLRKLAMTVSMYRYCEEEQRDNPLKNNILSRFASMAIINSIISMERCATDTSGLAKLG